jgi:hypothetical protein
MEMENIMRNQDHGGSGTSDSKASPAQTYFSLFCYPWDVLDEGVDKFARLMRGLGVNHISMASSYHGGKALLPHNRQSRVYFIEEGAVYFQPSPEFFGSTRIKPRVSRLAAERDVFREIVESCAQRGVATTAWTVTVHNTHLGEEYPELTTENVYGDRYPHSLCPSQPDVMAYMRALAANLASLPLDAVEWETFEYIPYRHYAFVEKEGIGITPMASVLLSLCFCPACLAAAQQRRINTKTVAKGVKKWLNDYFEGKNRSLGPVESQLARVPGLAEYLDMRFNVLADGLKEAADVLHAEKKKVISIIISQETRLDYATGVDLERLAKISDAIEILFYGRPAREASAAVQAIRDGAAGEVKVYAAVRPGNPDAEDAEGVIEMTNSLLRAGIDGISYYNFGLLEKFHLDWVRQAIAQSGSIRPARARAGGKRLKVAPKTGFVTPNVLRPSA